jgi:geranylgeranyl pyrophosphate synthase
MNYIDFAYEKYKNKIFPLISNFDYSGFLEDDNNKIFQQILDYCIFEEEPSGRRFYPSSLFILFYSFFSGKEATESEYKVSAAIELFHNSSLSHDDVLDLHDYRREKQTILKTSGLNNAVLAANSMLGITHKFLDNINNVYREKIRHEFSRAIIFLNHGQYLDEDCVWNNLPISEWPLHWINVVKYKMITGFLAVRCAAIASGKYDKVDDINRYEMLMSEISQIINDTGDLYKFYGYYLSTKTIRESAEEMKKKVTYPLIWLFQNNHDLSFYTNNKAELNIIHIKDLLERNNYYENTISKIEALKSEASRIIHNLKTNENIYTNFVLDFTNKPSLPPKNIFDL